MDSRNLSEGWLPLALAFEGIVVLPIRFSRSFWAAAALMTLAVSATGSDSELNEPIGKHCGIAVQTLTGDVFGTLEGDLEAEVDPGVCSGQERPTGSGIRLRFRIAAGDGLPEGLVILGIDALQPDQVGSGFRTTVTLIDEDQQLFYSTGDQDSCFSDIEAHETLQRGQASIVSGNVWCTRAIPAVNADGSLRIRNWRFDGVVRWRDS
ncbi:MAG: hypothetical protein AAGL69_09915 [Pseudomonadota bacterium]